MQINDTDIMINDYTGESELFSHNAHFPSEEYAIEVLDDKGLFMLYSVHKAMRNPFYKVKIFQYSDGKLTNIWSSLDIDSYINHVDLDNKTIDIAVKPMLDSRIIALSKEQAQRMNEHFVILKENGVLDDGFWKEIEENLLYELINVTTIDYNDDEKKLELVLTISFDTVGAKTPPFGERAIMIFSIEDSNIIYKDMIMESENTNKQLANLFHITIPQTMMVNWE